MTKSLLLLAGLCFAAASARAQTAAFTAADPAPAAMKTRLDRRMQAKYAEKIADINEDYEEDVEEINKSSMPQELKELRLQQAAQERDLALKQAAEKAEMKQAHRDALKAMPAYGKTQRGQKTKK